MGGVRVCGGSDRIGKLLMQIDRCRQVGRVKGVCCVRVCFMR